MKRTSSIFVTLAILAMTPATQSQIFGGGIVLDPTQSLHALQQILQANQLYTTTMQTTQNIIGAYNLAKQMASSPTSLYRPFTSPNTYWTALQVSSNTYRNTQAWTNAANTGSGAIAGYRQATIPQSATIPQYASMSAEGHQQIAAQGATSDLNDSVTTTNLQSLGTIRNHSERRQPDIAALESATQAVDPAQHTEQATLQRINQALLLQLRTQQDANQINETSALQQIVAQKQQQDALKAAFQDSAAYAKDYSTTIVPMTSRAASALKY